MGDHQCNEPQSGLHASKGNQPVAHSSIPADQSFMLVRWQEGIDDAGLNIPSHPPAIKSSRAEMTNLKLQVRLSIRALIDVALA